MDLGGSLVNSVNESWRGDVRYVKCRLFLIYIGICLLFVLLEMLK